jgi:hypothetical protein
MEALSDELLSSMAEKSLDMLLCQSGNDGLLSQNTAGASTRTDPYKLQILVILTAR